jgi:hypothetical protein
MSAQTQGRTRHQRIEAKCKKIWGADKEIDINIETDEYSREQNRFPVLHFDSFSAHGPSRKGAAKSALTHYSVREPSCVSLPEA